MDRAKFIEEEIARLRLEATRVREDKERKQAEYEKYLIDNKLLYFGQEGYGRLGKYGKWELNPVQREFFDEFRRCRKSTYGIAGANRIGKTMSGAVIGALTCLRGHFPWEDVKAVGNWLWRARGWKPPIKISIIGQDWEKHLKTVVIPTMKEMYPKSWGITTTKNSLGVDAIWTLEGYGQIFVYSNNSESDLFEGSDRHCLIYDEPPKRDNRIAASRGLIDNNGIELFTMTLLKEAWVDQEVVNATLDNGEPDPKVYFLIADITKNIGYGISQDGVDEFRKKLTSDEVKTRIEGIPAYKQGLVLTFNRNKHVVDRFEIPSHWPVDVGIDIGLAKPHDITYLATAENGFKYLCFSETVKGDGTMIADSIIKTKNRYNLRINRVICDPLAKSDRNNENSTWEKINDHLFRFSLYLEAGSKDQNDGIIAINNLLETINGIPALFVFRDCVRAIKQIEGWLFKEGEPISTDEDQCENLYRLCLLGTRFFELRDKKESNESIFQATKNATTGY